MNQPEFKPACYVTLKRIDTVPPAPVAWSIDGGRWCRAFWTREMMMSLHPGCDGCARIQFDADEEKPADGSGLLSDKARADLVKARGDDPIVLTKYIGETV